MPDLLDQYLAEKEEEKEPDLLDQYLAAKPIEEEPSEEPTWWEAAFAPAKEYEEVYAPELGKMVPGKRVEVPIGTKILERLKFEWETDWPTWIGLGIFLGTYGGLRAIPVVGESIISKNAAKFAKTNLPVLKKRFPDVIKTVEDAKVYAELAMKHRLGPMTEKLGGLRTGEALQAINKLASQIGKLKLAAPKVIPALPAVAEKVVTPEVIALTSKLVHAGLDKIGAEALAGSMHLMKEGVNKLVVSQVIDDFVDRSMAKTEGLAPLTAEEKLGFTEMREALDERVTGVLEKEQKVVEPTPGVVAPEVAPKAPLDAIREAEKSDELVREYAKLTGQKYKKGAFIKGLEDDLELKALSEEIYRVQKMGDFGQVAKLEREGQRLVQEKINALPEVPPREDLTLAMRNTKTGEIITATPDEKIHTDMIPRLRERIDDKDMEPGWVDSKGKFYNVWSGRRTLAGFEPTEVAPKAETAAEEAARHAKMTTEDVMAELGEVDDIQAEAQLEAEAMAAGVPKVELPEEKIPEEVVPKVEPEVLAEEITPPEVEPPIKPPIPPSPPPKEMPEFAGEPIEDPIAKLNELIKAAKPLRGKLEKAYTAERGKRIAEVEKFIDETIDTVGGEEGYKMILSKLKGELAPPEMKIAFEPIKEKLTEEQLKSLYVRTWKHPYLSEWEKVSVADGLTNLLMGGIPQPKKLVLLEEVYGSELIKNILSKRVWGAKATDFLIEAANVPRAALATADMSAFLRQGVIELAAHPVVSVKAIGKTFQFAFDPLWGGRSFEQYFVDLRKDPLYPVMRKSGLSVTDPSRAGMQEREEAFISRFLQKIPIVKIPVEFAERAYVGFLNKVRVDLFKTWADELLSKGHTPTKDPELFKSAADVVNTFTGRGSLGRAGNRITPQLNTLFFSPRLIAARFNALNPVWYAKQPKEIRKKAIGDIAKFVVAGLTVLALVKTYKEATRASDDEISVETDTRSSDSGKIKIGNTRFDIWGGFQQWVRVFTQLITGERKNTKTGEIISLTKDEYPFTTRKEVLLRFMEGKLAPVPQLVNELISGAKTFGGEDITAGYITKSKFVPMYIQDIAEAYTDGGLGKAVGVSVPAFFGVGVQTWEPRKKKGRKYWWE